MSMDGELMMSICIVGIGVWLINCMVNYYVMWVSYSNMVFGIIFLW